MFYERFRNQRFKSSHNFLYFENYLNKTYNSDVRVGEAVQFDDYGHLPVEGQIPTPPSGRLKNLEILNFKHQN